MNTSMSALVLENLDRYTGTTHWAGRVGEETLKAYETQLGFSLPEQYRQFVARFGCGNIDRYEILGLGIPDTGVPHGMFVLRQLRELGISVPKFCAPVTITPQGGYWYMLGKQYGELPIGCIIESNPVDQSLLLCHSSFNDFLLNILTSRLLAE